MPQVILTLPAYNEAENIEPLLVDAEAVLTGLGHPYQIIVVNDGSSDATAAIVRRLQGKLPHLHLVEHSRNQGLGAAITTAIHSALGRATAPDDVIVSMDADNTHSPAYIRGMADKVWTGNYDVVIASRFREGSKELGVPLFRLALSRGARFLFQLFLRLPDVRDYTCGYRAYRAELLQRATDKYGDQLITRQGFACTDELLVKLSTLTRRITEVPFVLRYDKKRNQSKLPLFRTVWETLKMLITKH